MKRISYLITSIFAAQSVLAQFDTLHVNMAGSFARGKQFSGLFINKNLLFVLPQNSSFDSNPKYLYAFSVAQAYENAHSANKKILKPLRRFAISGLTELFKNENQFNKTYDGLEAMTIVGDSCYLLIETKSEGDHANQFCYLVMGVFGNRNGNDILVIQGKPLKLPKPVKSHLNGKTSLLENAGFESMYYDAQLKKLKVLFEYNGMDVSRLVYEIPLNIEFANQVSTQKLIFRLTDVTHNDKGELYGINYYWGGEFNTYLANKKDQAEAKKVSRSISIPLKTDKNFYYCRIVKMSKNGWESKGTIPAFKSNWEGIAWYKNGFFLISDDNENAELFSSLIYITPTL